ncbi:MAG TPA: UDP-N-acetylmuramoyl-L-alanine--D-glutamate ligase [Bacteroidales bacterium]|nr:UDP-N-acetylmuramoyl-L-alanine--D-glutamate ligase [Bacteroidales bacterium]HPS74258.1 UDP-N-acetylmuramoyl-L-alanine--D-glutamate ligase [Bacteroidales bacterium]
MHDLIRNMMKGKRVLLLGFGREGQVSYQVIRQALPGQRLIVADGNEKIRDHELLRGDPDIDFQVGPGYLDGLDRFDLIVKSPGITLKDIVPAVDPARITSQTDLFLRKYSRQIIGVTGTKGKSTTSSLIYHILNNTGVESLLLGNIGTPAFHFLDKITPSTTIVFELSSHQLQYVICSPHIAILLNLYQEHLDAYRSFLEYQLAKMNITRFQQEGDYFIYNSDDQIVAGHAAAFRKRQTLIPFSLSEVRDPVLGHLHNRYLRGDHNRMNAMAAVKACRLCGLADDDIAEGLDSFKGLAHRMEYAGRYHGIDFYNDSIATIPEACMAAVRAIPGVDTLILGGFDRGISYDGLAQFLVQSEVSTFILTGMAGERIAQAMEAVGIQGKRLIRIHRFDDFAGYAVKYTRPGHVCLLSPAAASYDEFRSFEERGMRFTELISKAENT